MDKAPEAFRTISEVAEQLDVPQHVLRFWETRFSQVKPMKRGGGRRYYRPSDVDLLAGIRELLYGQGYTIRGVQRILREHGVAHVIGIGRGEVTVEPEVKAAKPAPSPPQPGSAPPAPATAAPRTAGLSKAVRDALQEVLGELEAARKALDVDKT